MNTTLISSQIAKHIRELYLGTNWTVSNLKEHLSDVSWDQANKSIYGLNSILALTYHIHYYLLAHIAFIKTGELSSQDKYSFDHPEITSQIEWENYKLKLWEEVEIYALLIEKMTDKELNNTFKDEKYGNYYRNLNGVIEHGHYHLGQIVLIKKILKTA